MIGFLTKQSMKFFFLTLAVVAISSTIIGCETEGENRTTSQSAIPWNRPASWEGGGMLGAMGMGSH